jgi:hypothetical protein
VNAAAENTESAPAPIFRRLHCHALTTDPRALKSDPHARCGNLLGYAEHEVRFVDLAARAPSQPDDRDWRRCARCKTWNIFEAVTG